MSLVNVTDASVVCPNPAPLTADFAFSVSLDCLQDLTLPLTWRLIYVTCPDDVSKDQELENVEIGPLKRGSLRFRLEAAAPDLSAVDPEEVWGSTVVLLEVSYRHQEFLRIGWYVHNVYADPLLQEDPPDVADLSKMIRYIAADEPRVTRFNIQWDEFPRQMPEPTHPLLPPNVTLALQQQAQQQQQKQPAGLGGGGASWAAAGDCHHHPAPGGAPLDQNQCPSTQSGSSFARGTPIAMD